MQNSAFPITPPLMPKRGMHPRSIAFFRKISHWQGWEIRGEIPNIPKAVLITAPHTSNLDGWFGVPILLGLDLQATIMAKHTLFKKPFIGFLNWVGFTPVKRDAAGGMVDDIVTTIRQRERIWLIIAPEGTRLNAPHLKTGFYRIAYAAQIPIVMISFDYQQRCIHILGQFQPTGDMQQDIPAILEHYRGHFSPAHLHRLSQPFQHIR